jgi:hypothetical protein
MNLTLHHFRKEFRYLRLRWLVWLVVLGLQLAVDVEWVMPMRVGVPSPGWLGLLPVLMWGGAVMLALGYAKEDAQADDRSFIAVRPLPSGSYWWSRGLVFLVLIMVPLVLQEGLYLVVSGVGTKDVLLGMWERFFITGAALGWLVPMPLMAAGGARWMVAGVAVLTGLLAQSICVQMLQQRQLYPEMFYGESSLAQAAWVGAVAIALLAWLQKRGGWPLHRMLAAVAGLVIACYALAWTPWLRPSSWSAREPDLMARLEVTHAELPRPHSFRLLPLNDDTGASVVYMDGDLMPLPVPAELLPHWSVRDAALTQKGATVHAKSIGAYNRRFFWPQYIFTRDDKWLLSSLPGAVVPETLSMAAQYSLGRNGCSFGRWPTPEDLQSPADIEVQLEADWLRQSVLGSCELRSGAVLRSEYADMEVLEVHPHQNGNGEKQAGNLTIIFKLTKREIETGGSPFTFGTEMSQMLYAPAQQLFWQREMGSTGGELQFRAMNRGRTRMLHSITYKDVLTPATGIREAEVPALRFLLRKQDYAGTSRHHLSMKGMDLQENLRHRAWYYPVGCPLIAAAPRAGMLREFERIPKPTPDAGPEAVARFVADVITLSQALEWRHDLKKDGSVRYPGNDHAVVDAVAPYLLRHPEVLTRQAHLFVSRDNPFVRELLDATLLLAGLPGVEREPYGLRYTEDTSAKSVTGLLNPIETRVGGWTALAPAIEAALQQRSVQPILAVHEKWRSEMRFVRPDEEWLDDLKQRFSMSSLWALKGNDAREQARGLIRREYELSVPPMVQIGSEQLQVVECAIAIGMEAALDQRLRGLRFWDEKKFGQRELYELSMLSRLFGSQELLLKWEEALPFLRRMRELRAADFSYDAATLTWKPISKP